MSHVLLPISKEVFDFLADQIGMRGQADRIRGNIINMEGVNVLLDPDHVLTAPLYGVTYANRTDNKQG